MAEPRRRPKGRPKMPAGKAKTTSINLRVRLEERELFEQAANASGLSLSEWARKVLLESAEK